MYKYYFLYFILVLFWACKQDTTTKNQAKPNASKTVNTQRAKAQMHEISGKTMGTYYLIKYIGQEIPKLKDDVDAVLKEINRAVSTYDPTSIISKFNQHQSTKPFLLDAYKDNRRKYFIDNFKIAQSVYELSSGLYDPTVMPLVNYWGFGYAGRKKIHRIDSAKVRAILPKIGLNKIRLEDTKLTKDLAEIELDFSSVAKGYAVDQVAQLLDARRSSNYYIEIGGECRAKGYKHGKAWTVGISYPDTSARMADIITKVPLWNNSVATSGNYRNYYKTQGVFVGHTINPKTGFPQTNRLLSATVFYPDCATADALTTACMAMGYEKAFVMIDEMPDAECYLVWVNAFGKVQESMTSQIAKIMLDK